MGKMKGFFGFDKKEEPPLCACGCGQQIKNKRDGKTWNRYIKHHNLDDPNHYRPGFTGKKRTFTEEWKQKLGQATKRRHERNRTAKQKEFKLQHREFEKQEPPLCKCGCGEKVKESKTRPCTWNEFIFGHWGRTRIISKETRRKIGLASKGRIFSQETREKMGRSRRGRKHSEESKRRIGRANSGKNNGMKSKEARRKVSEYWKKKWSDPKFRKEQFRKITERFSNKINKREIVLLKFLFKLSPYEYKFVGNGKKWIAGKNPDFLNVKGKRKVIELFGDYWHSRKWTGKSKKEHENERKGHFWKYGYNCLVIWDHELENLKTLKKKIVRFNEQ